MFFSVVRCLAPDCQVGGLGCDNMTVVLVCLLHNNQPWPSLVARCGRLQQAKDAAARQEMEEELRLAEEEAAESAAAADGPMSPSPSGVVANGETETRHGAEVEEEEPGD
jgi:hypothetical protein